MEICSSLAAAPSNLADPLQHFLGGLVGEGDGRHVPGLEAAFLDQIGNLLGDDPGLAEPAPPAPAGGRPGSGSLRVVGD